MTYHPADGLFILVVGPGGAGKDTLMKRVFEQIADDPTLPIHSLVTATTRRPRVGEQNGIAYHFKSHNEFQQMIADNALIEYQQVTSGNYYGVPRTSVEAIVSAGEHVMGDVDVYGALRILEEYPRVLPIFVTVGTADMSDEARLAILRARMEGRGDSPESITERLERASTLEFPFEQQCSFVIYNNNIDEATRDFLNVLHTAIREQKQAQL